jgi:hypothetical protein
VKSVLDIIKVRPPDTVYLPREVAKKKERKEGKKERREGEEGRKEGRRKEEEKEKQGQRISHAVTSLCWVPVLEGLRFPSIQTGPGGGCKPEAKGECRYDRCDSAMMVTNLLTHKT